MAGDLDMDVQLVAGADRAAEFGVLDGHEDTRPNGPAPGPPKVSITSTAAVCAIDSMTSTPGTSGTCGKMALEIALADGDVLDADGGLAGHHVDQRSIIRNG